MWIDVDTVSLLDQPIAVLLRNGGDDVVGELALPTACPTVSDVALMDQRGGVVAAIIDVLNEWVEAVGDANPVFASLVIVSGLLAAQRLGRCS